MYSSISNPLEFLTNFPANSMVLKIYMVTQNRLRTCEGKQVFSEKTIHFVTGLDLIKCLKQIKLRRLLLVCKLISELPSIYKYHVQIDAR